MAGDLGLSRGMADELGLCRHVQACVEASRASRSLSFSLALSLSLALSRSLSCLEPSRACV
jgi:hypothetical protein